MLMMPFVLVVCHTPYRMYRHEVEVARCVPRGVPNPVFLLEIEQMKCSFPLV